MLNAIRASFYKMFHDRAFGVYVAGTVAWTMVVIAAQVLTCDMRGIEDVSELANRWYGFIGLHSIEVPLIGSSVLLFSGEFRNKSWKLLIAKGISRTSFYLSKLISILTLTVLISFVSILVIAVGNVVILHAAFDLTYVGNVFWFFLGETIAHMTIAVLIIMIICVVKRGEVAMMLCFFLMVFGYALLHALENALGAGEIITDIWAFSQTAFADFGGPIRWGWLLLMFLGHLVVCSLITILFLNHKDIE